FLDRPPGMLRDYWVGVFSHSLEVGDKLAIAAVAHGNSHVPPQPAAFCATNRGPAKLFAVSTLVHSGQPTQARLKQTLARLGFGYHRGRSVTGLMVPGADVLTDVAPEYVLSHGSAQCLSNGPALLNGEVSNATACVQFPRRNDGLCRAGVDTARATAAAVG